MSSQIRQLSFDTFSPEPTLFKIDTGAKNGKSARDKLLRTYADKLFLNPALNRSLVSFQANKTTAFYRWFKYREGFSHEMVRYFLEQFPPTSKARARILDPFAGAGTTLTTSTREGWKATGIELLPVGAAAIRARVIADNIDVSALEKHFKRLQALSLDGLPANGYRFSHVRITDGAFPEETEHALSAYMSFVETIDNTDARYLFWFACFSILEDVSYTRKDGQYLRWDYRSCCLM